MIAEHVGILLAKIRLYDNREITSEVFRLWADAFEPVGATPEDAVEALHMHMRESVEYLRPAHIVANLRRIREERAGRFHPELESNKPEFFVPDPKPTNFDALAASWDDPVKFGLETLAYRKQVAEYHRKRRETA